MANFGRILKRLAPIVAVAMAGGLAGCNGADIRVNGDEGKPLSELDLAGARPTALTLLGPDKVVITEGDALDIKVEGDEDDALRFVLEDGSLAILRKEGSWSNKNVAIVNVTMPAPRELVMAGSGSITSASLAAKADVTIAGSGSIEASNVATDRLDVTIAGSGDFTAAGTAKVLDLTVAGSGAAKLTGLSVDKADVTIAGSGSVDFASDGEVNAEIVGSGDVTVTGSATCTMSGVGSGTLRCKPPASAPASD